VQTNASPRGCVVLAADAEGDQAVGVGAERVGGKFRPLNLAVRRHCAKRGRDVTRCQGIPATISSAPDRTTRQGPPVCRGSKGRGLRRRGRDALNIGFNV
jgi:hypothetical protein